MDLAIHGMNSLQAHSLGFFGPIPHHQLGCEWHYLGEVHICAHVIRAARKIRLGLGRDPISTWGKRVKDADRGRRGVGNRQWGIVLAAPGLMEIEADTQSLAGCAEFAFREAVRLHSHKSQT